MISLSIKQLVGVAELPFSFLLGEFGADYAFVLGNEELVGLPDFAELLLAKGVGRKRTVEGFDEKLLSETSVVGGVQENLERN